ncbi:MAG: ABC transporter ATP-binding protein [Oscillospiraceae bacterium]|nr:ABC transporter ATP-binding protein [Oscillospiraceae bacterium]
MARSIEKLREQYNTKASPKQMGRGPGSRGGAQGKPKNMGATVARLFSYYKGYRHRLVAVLLMMLLTTVCSLVGGYFMAPIIDRLTLAVAPNAEIRMSAMERAADRMITSVVGADAGAMTYIMTAAVMLGVIYMTAVVLTYLQERLMVETTQKIVENIRNGLFEKLEYLPIRYFDSKPTGEIMSRFTNDVDNIDMMLGDTLTSVISGVVSLIGTVIFMLTTNVVLTIVIVVFIPLIMLVVGVIGKRSSKYYRGQQAALGAINGYMEETVTGAKVVKVFNHEADCVEEFNLLNDDMRDTQFKAQFWGGVTMPIMSNVSQISYAAVVGVGGLLMVAGSLTPGGLTVFAGYSRQFSMPISRIASQMATIFSALAGAERVFEVMDTEPEQPDAPDADPMPDMKGDIVLDDVSFGYVPGKTVLKHISLYAHPGQKIAFVGSTGAGKTTVTNLLNRFYDVQEGSIRIDGVDVRDIKRDVLRQNIAMVLQDTHLFTGTVRENIRYGRLDATDEEVVEAAKIASAHSFIMRLENGYDTMIEGDGTNLSQGQRQLLNIARAAISKAPVLVLDEATSSVDTRTERHIERGMDRIMKSRTTFVIAHRLSTVRNANAIMVLENGEIIERGDHDDLLAMKGRYYELYTGRAELA